MTNQEIALRLVRVAKVLVAKPEKDWIVARKLDKVLPNEEALYTEIWNSGKTVRGVHLNWFFDGHPKKLEFDTRKN